jgi:hypothetical protein
VTSKHCAGVLQGFIDYYVMQYIQRSMARAVDKVSGMAAHSSTQGVCGHAGAIALSATSPGLWVLAGHNGLLALLSSAS